MTWTPFTIEKSGESKKFGIKEKSAPISQQRFLYLLRESAEFIDCYNDILASSGYDAFFWENKPVTLDTLHNRYECNLINTQFLANKAPDLKTFRRYFKDEQQVVSFPNRGGDALLVVPCPEKKQPGYAHIGDFVRQAGEEQVQALWRTVGEQTLQAIGQEPKWLSTSGLGVYWLHVRIDSRPKYYQTEEYKRLTAG